LDVIEERAEVNALSQAGIAHELSDGPEVAVVFVAGFVADKQEMQAVTFLMDNSCCANKNILSLLGIKATNDAGNHDVRGEVEHSASILSRGKVISKRRQIDAMGNDMDFSGIDTSF
jgi:hypothetical protein